MAATDSLGGTLLSVYGLRLSRLDGYLDLPRYKSIVAINDLHSEVKKTEERKIKVKLIGFYSSTAAMVSAIEDFKAKIKGAVKQTWIFSDHGFSETCFVKDVVKVEIYGRKNVEINLTLNVTT